MNGFPKHEDFAGTSLTTATAGVRRVENNIELTSRKFVTQDFVILFGKLSIDGMLAKVLSVSANGVTPTANQMTRFAAKFKMSPPWDFHLHGPKASHVYKFMLH